jgi:hypothetical protein
MLMDIIPPTKGTVSPTGLKRKIQQFVVYRRPISPSEISISLG